MKLKSDDEIRTECATYIGTLTWIDWERNVGRALLDAGPGADPNAPPEEVECTFRYMGQHWIWNMDAYPDEDAASHSAFAFCIGDRVIFLHKVRKPEPGQTPPQPPEKEYVGVAVLKEEDDGNGGKSTSIEKRKVWPLYRIGHESVVLDFKYSGLDDKGAGFPFLSHVHVPNYPGAGYAYYYDGRRELHNPYTDQQGHERAFGTPKKDGGWGNQRLVVTKEKNERDETVFVPHAIHEFCEGDENIPYVPDVLMQTRPNWRGRTIGWSAHDEILIDNIPIARAPSNSIEAIIPSMKATTKKIIHIDEKSNTLTVLFITVDCHYEWRPYANSGAVANNGAVNWYPPKYAFYVQRGSISELCPYAVMETPRNELPVIEMRTDEAASWLWRDLRAIRPQIFMQNNCLDNLSDGIEVVAPGQEVEVCFWAGVFMMGLYVGEQSDIRRKISLIVSTAADGSILMEKKVGDPEPFAPIDSANLDSHVNLGEQLGGSPYVTQQVLEDYARITRPIVEEAARLGQTSLLVELSGKDDFRRENATHEYDTDLRKTYRHKSPDGDFVIAEEKQIIQGQRIIQGQTPGALRVTLSMIVFTHIDLRGGVYGFWEVTWFEDADVKYLLGTITDRPPEPYYIKWRHYVRSRSCKVLSHSYDMEIPFCLDGPYTSGQIEYGLVPDEELDRMETVRTLGMLLTNFYQVNRRPLPNIWDVPRLYEDGAEKAVTDRWYRFPVSLDSFTRSAINYISAFLMITAPDRGSKRATVIQEYEQNITYGVEFWDNP